MSDRCQWSDVMSRSHPRLTVGVALVITAFGMGACSILPTVNPDLARTRGAVPQLQGSRGPLSPAQSKAVLDRLQASGVATDIFDRHLALEEALVGTPLSAGNEVVLLQDGPATYRAMFASIAAAKDHINMETYLLEDDEVGQRFARALVGKQQQGVQVNLIRDSAGTFATPAAFFKPLIDSGVKILEYNPINPLLARKGWELNQRDHRKLLIVDGRTAFLGGINISSVYSGGSFSQRSKVPSDGSLAWRDTDLQLQGPVVAEFQKLFLETWASQKGDPLPAKKFFPPLEVAGKQVVRAVGSSPDDPYSLIYVTLLSAIASAETTIHLTNAYFVPDPQLIAALKAAVQRGVDVKLILPSQTDSWLTFYAGRGYYEELLTAGVKIYERQGVILHSKTALIDGVWATIGSTNLDWRSFLHNREINAVVVGVEFGAQVQSMFDKDLAQSDKLTLAQWTRRPVDVRVKELFASVWQYWL